MFIQSNTDGYILGHESYDNIPINLDTVAYIKRGEFKHFYIGKPEPAINFYNIHGSKILQWIYGSEEDRDADYERVMGC